MAAAIKKAESVYSGFEQGPIRPPSEAASLLLRVTRNCPWNKCTFCPVYKEDKIFSLRPVEHVLKDIDTICRFVEILGEKTSRVTGFELSELAAGLSDSDRSACYAAAQWIAGGMTSVFLQDGDSLVIKPADMVTILKHICDCFPGVVRITSYARSRTIDRITDKDLVKIREAGLNRIHVGMESGSDRVLQLIGSTLKSDHILNLFQEIEGVFPQDKSWMIGVIRRFLALSPQEQTLFIVGRRSGIFHRLDDLDDPDRRKIAHKMCQRLQISPENVDTVVAELLERFI